MDFRNLFVTKKNQVIVKYNPVVCQFSEYFLDLIGNA